MKASSRPARLVTKEEQLLAQERLRHYYAEHEASPTSAEFKGKSLVAQCGQVMWPHTYKGAASDEAARDNWTDYVGSLQHTNPEAHYVMSAQMKLSDVTILMLGGAKWFREGLPVYRLGHKQAASYMATTVSVDMAEHVKPPHRAFYIELPGGLVEIADSSGEFQEAIGVFVHLYAVTTQRDALDGSLPPGDYWRWMALTRSVVTLWEMNRRVEELIAGTVLPEDEYYGIGFEMDEHDLRVRRLITRLITSLCLDLTSGKELKRRREPLVKGDKKGPCFDVFLDPTKVDFDARPYVQAFLSGNRKSPDFQHLVAGHWKQQAYGPGHSLRKPIHVLPYKRLEHLPEKPQP